MPTTNFMQAVSSITQVKLVPQTLNHAYSDHPLTPDGTHAALSAVARDMATGCRIERVCRRPRNRRATLRAFDALAARYGLGYYETTAPEGRVAVVFVHPIIHDMLPPKVKVPRPQAHDDLNASLARVANSADPNALFEIEIQHEDGPDDRSDIMAMNDSLVDQHGLACIHPRTQPGMVCAFFLKRERYAQMIARANAEMDAEWEID